ncbi:hypothetical protein TNCV_2756561 [Trichonephila clavipes]|nr:hypothetical protein TNCV_2756561 [Trichonephila clavipes]
MDIHPGAQLAQETATQKLVDYPDHLQTKLGCITDPTIKQQSSERKHPSSPTLKKAKTVKLAGKVMTIILFDYEEIV